MRRRRGSVQCLLFFLSLFPPSSTPFQREFSSRVSDFLFKRATTTSRPLPLFACFPAQKTIFCAPPYRAGAGVLPATPATTVTTQHRPCKLYTEPPISDLMTRAVAPLLPRPHSSFTSNYRQLVSPWRDAGIIGKFEAISFFFFFFFKNLAIGETRVRRVIIMNYLFIYL